MKIKIVLDVPEEYQDPDHESGMTEEGHDALSQDLMGWSIVSGPDLVPPNARTS